MLSVVTENLTQTGPVWWIPLGVGLAALAAGLGALSRAGSPRRPLLRRPADSLSRITGLPA